MAFVHLEDIQGSIEVVVFPRVYAATRDLWKEDKILIVRGRVDGESREPKILCESVQDYVMIARPEDTAPPDKRTAPAVQESRAPYGEGPVPSQQSGVSESSREASSAPSPSQPVQVAHSLAHRHLHITIHRTGDQTQDKQRVRRVYSLLQRYSGQDRFTFLVVNGRHQVQIDFPNATTSYTSELARSLQDMLGGDALHVL